MVDCNIFRVCKDKENPYVMINKNFLNDESLSLKAKGLLAYLLSLPDDWKIYENELVKRHKDGRDSLRSGIDELIQSGHITRDKIRNEKGQFVGYKYIVYECPNRSGKSNYGEPKYGEPAPTNNNQTNNKIKYTPLPPKGDFPLFPEAEQKAAKNKIDYRQDDFKTFWDLYPIQKSKGAARKAWDALAKNKKLPDIRIIVEAIQKQMYDRQMKQSSNVWVPEMKHPSTWLNKECWADIIENPICNQDNRLYPLFDPEVDCL